MVNLELNNVTYKYNDKLALYNISMNFNNTFTAIVGSSSSGKSTISKLLNHSIDTKGITINDIEIDNTNTVLLYHYVGVVDNNISFVTEKVKNELAFSLENINTPKKDIIKNINEISSYFKINNLLLKNPYYLYYEQQIMIKILSLLIRGIHYLVIDTVFEYLSKENKDLIITYLKDNHIKLILITTNMDNIINSDYIYVLHQGKIIMEGNSKSVFNEEKILKRIGLYLPSIVDISVQLKSYGVINKIYYNEKEMVDDIWK